MCSTSTFTCIKSMVSNCTIFINLSVLSLNIFWQMQQNFAFSCNSSSLFVNGTFFLISKSIISIACFLKDSQKKSGSFHTCVLMLIVYTIQCTYCIHWKTTFEYVNLILLRIIFQNYF